MRNMGWTPGQCIGKQSQGISEPIPAQVGQTDRAGLGLPGKGGGRWKPPKKEKLVGVWTPTKIVYGTCEGPYLRVHRLDIKGRPVPTDELILVTEEQIRKVLQWGAGVVGIAESTFPHPQEWRLEDTGVDLDKLSVKILTGALTRLRTLPPTCLTKWPEKIQARIDLRGISLRYAVGIGVPTVASGCR